nr:inorganic pyrophosphatase [uncultured bacterium]
MPKTDIPKTPFDKLRAMSDTQGLIQVVIETPRGSRNKYKYDEELRLFRLNSVLPAGSAFPYDFGYVPGTRADDGDPLDVLVLMDQPAFTGCVIEARLIGVLEAEQTEDGETERNDRVVAVAKDAHDYANLHTLKDLDANLLRELEHFFVSYSQMKGREFRLLAAKGPRAAQKLVDEALARQSKK